MKSQKFNSKVKSKYSICTETFKFLHVFLTFSFLLLTLGLRQVAAQQVSLAISPPLVELVIKPGKSVLVAFNLDNLSDPAIAQATVRPFTAKDELGNIQIAREFAGPIRFSLDNSEIKLDQPFFLKSKGSQQLLLRLRVPENTPEGDYYYSFLSQTSPPPTKEGVASNRVRAGIGANILVTVTSLGNLDIKGKINSFEVLSKFKLNLFGRPVNLFESTDKIPLILIVENNGKNVIKPQGQIELRGNFGEKATFDIIPDNVLAGSTRLLEASPAAEIDYPRPASLVLTGFFIGRYKLSTTLNFGENTPSLYASTSFIALPLKIIIALVSICILAVIIIKRVNNPEEN